MLRDERPHIWKQATWRADTIPAMQQLKLAVWLAISVALVTRASDAAWTSLNEGAGSFSVVRQRVVRSVDSNSGNTTDEPPPEEACQRCALPDCYCQKFQESIPGGLARRDTPQIVTFTYSGPVTDKIRKEVASIFPAKRKNPNGCAVAITLFVSGTLTDPCTVHEMYTRGHEIGLQSKNFSSAQKWSPTEWKQQIADYRHSLSKAAFVPMGHIQGVRAPKNEPGGDVQFQLLRDEDFMYDSTLKDGPVVLEEPQVWPFTLEEPFQHDMCDENVNCPNKSYPPLWVVPSVKLVRGKTSCTYFDECVSDFTTREEVFDLLAENFLRNYGSNRAPFQVNLLQTTFASDTRVAGLQDFVDWVTGADDTWILPIQETLSWMRNPVRKADVGSLVAWDCPDRDYHRNCRAEKDKGSGRSGTVSYSDFIDVDDLILWQYIILGAAFLLVLRYDRWLPADAE